MIRAFFQILKVLFLMIPDPELLLIFLFPAFPVVFEIPALLMKELFQYLKV